MITINIPIWPLVFGLGWFAGVVTMLFVAWLFSRKKGEGEND